jgi:hypothetical protein
LASISTGEALFIFGISIGRASGSAGIIIKYELVVAFNANTSISQAALAVFISTRDTSSINFNFSI